MFLWVTADSIWRMEVLEGQKSSLKIQASESWKRKISIWRLHKTTFQLPKGIEPYNSKMAKTYTHTPTYTKKTKCWQDGRIAEIHTGVM